MELGHPLAALRQAGLVTAVGYDAYVRRIVFPLEGNLYGRSISPSAPPHRFLPGTKGGLYCWEQARQVAEVILVEGLFDYASLWQAGFRNVTCAMGTHLNRHQFRQLCDRPRTVYLAFDADTNGSGQRASQSLACRLREQGLNARTVSLPDRHDPNSFFLQGARHASVPLAVGVCSVMKFRVMYQQPVAGAQSPVRIVEQTSGRALGWINRFLDREYVRRVAERTLRIDA